MTTQTVLTAKILEVTAAELHVQYDYEDNETEVETSYTFPVYEFSNGVILVPSESTNDWFFASRNEIDACGTDHIVGIEETGKTSEWTIERLQESIDGSVSEFGEDDATAKAYELIA